MQKKRRNQNSQTCLFDEIFGLCVIEIFSRIPTERFICTWISSREPWVKKKVLDHAIIFIMKLLAPSSCKICHKNYDTPWKFFFFTYIFFSIIFRVLLNFWFIAGKSRSRVFLHIVYFDLEIWRGDNRTMRKHHGW